MAKQKTFFQCELRKGTGRDHAYIEDRGAVVGKSVELGGSGTGDFWTVASVSDRGVSEDQFKRIQNHVHKGWGSLIDI